MRTYIVRANQALFDKWKVLSSRIESLKSAVRNDMVISSEDAADWRMKAEALQFEMGELISETASHLRPPMIPRSQK